ncbi:MAG: hypothetical protein P8M67_00515 [Opitutales bacterium]|jgi:hypothetical protein|nr:hypothetical protein [Opitutales bacterium]
MFDWSDEKDVELRKTRGIGFEDIVFHLAAGDLLAIVPHPNAEKYPKQKIMYIDIDNYVYLVPFIEGDGQRFLKTIIPSRRATKELLREKKP